MKLSSIAYQYVPINTESMHRFEQVELHREPRFDSARDVRRPRVSRVQVIGLKKVSTSNLADRWRLVLSDGEYSWQSMLATQKNEMITSGEIQENCIIKLNDYIVNVVQNKK